MSGKLGLFGALHELAEVEIEIELVLAELRPSIGFRGRVRSLHLGCLGSGGFRGCWGGLGDRGLLVRVGRTSEQHYLH